MAPILLTIVFTTQQKSKMQLVGFHKGFKGVGRKMAREQGRKCHFSLLPLSLCSFILWSRSRHHTWFAIASLFLILTLSPNSSFAETATYQACDRSLHQQSSSEESLISFTQRLTSYFAYLHEHGILGKAELETILEHLQNQHTLINPFADKASIQTAAIHHSEVMNQYVSNLELLDLDEIESWIKNFLKQNEKLQEQKDNVQQQTAIAFSPMKFYQVDPLTPREPNLLVKFLRRLTDKRLDQSKAKIPFDHSFEMMNTVVTQGMWINVVGKIKNWHFKPTKNNAEALSLSVDGHIVWPDLPAWQPTWWSAIEFANRLSIQHKLTPVYDTSAIQYDPNTSLEQGNLAPIEHGLKAIKKLKINAPNNDVEQAEGFRLPTVKEFTYMGSAQHTTPDEISKSNLATIKAFMPSGYYGFLHSDLPWLPTDHFEPTIINGNNFYDLHTGPHEWLNDIDDTDHVATRMKTVIERQVFHSSILKFNFCHDNFGLTSFRLVRTIKPTTANATSTNSNL